MGIYISMEMPKSCGDCKAFVCYRQWAGDIGDCFCGITKNDARENEKNADCPLVPVPPHGDLIDRDALIKDGWHNLHKEVMRMGGYEIYELPLKNPSISVIIPAEPPKEEK